MKKQVKQLKYKIKYITGVKHFFRIQLVTEYCFKEGLFAGGDLYTDNLQWHFKLAGAHIFIYLFKNSLPLGNVICLRTNNFSSIHIN